MVPEAWNVEHNNRHHYNLSEVHDPDLVEANLTSLRDMPVPVFFKYIRPSCFSWPLGNGFITLPTRTRNSSWRLYARQTANPFAGVKPEESMTVKNIVAGQNPFDSLGST
jgi:hypothetical protein